MPQLVTEISKIAEQHKLKNNIFIVYYVSENEDSFSQNKNSSSENSSGKANKIAEGTPLHSVAEESEQNGLWTMLPRVIPPTNASYSAPRTMKIVGCYRSAEEARERVEDLRFTYEHYYVLQVPLGDSEQFVDRS